MTTPQNSESLQEAKTRKRAKSIPVLNASERPQSQLFSYGPRPDYSEELSDKVRKAIPVEWSEKLAMPAFQSTLGKLLGTYRYYDQLIGVEKAVKDVIAQLRLAYRVFDEAMMHLHHMPPLAKVLMQQLPMERTPYGRHDDPMFARLKDVVQISDDVGCVLATIQKDFAPCKGRQALWRRDLLLTDICESAKAHAITPLTWKAAGELAHSILIAAKIEVPADLPETLRIVRKVRKLRSEAERYEHAADADGK